MACLLAEHPLNSTTSHYLIPAEPGRGRALMLAAFVHLLLLILLWFGVSWQSDATVEVQAEIWSPVAREAAPPPPPPPMPSRVPEPPKPIAAVTPPTPAVESEPAQRQEAEPDIALEKEKKRKQQKDDADRLKKEKLAEKKALEEEQKRKKIADAEEKQQEKKKQAELEKIKQAEDKKQKEQAAIEEQQRKQEEVTVEQRARKRREENQRRINQLASEGVAGDADKSQGARGDDGYARKVAGLIKSHTILPQSDIVGNPAVEFSIELLPDGSLRGEPKMIKSSGVTAFDLAVKRAIEKSAPLPPDPSTGKVPANITITHRPKDSDTR